MYKALYGTISQGACWHDKLFDILQQMDFKPSKADPDIWMRHVTLTVDKVENGVIGAI